MNLKDGLREYAINVLGFDIVGFVSACDFKDNIDEWAKTIIVLGIEVWDEAFDMVFFRRRGDGFDVYYVYEVILAEKALRLCLYLRDLGFKARHEPYNLPLKIIASKAGVGCYGKNSLIINPLYGSRIRFTCVITSAEVEPDTPLNEDLCGKCSKCIEACPLKAIYEPYKVDPSRCVNSLPPPQREVSKDVVEAAPKLLKRPTENSLILCSLCQVVCPYNKRKKFLRRSNYSIQGNDDSGLNDLDEEDLEC